VIAATPEWLPAAVVGLLGGGVLVGLAAFIKARPEATKIVVDAAQGAVVVQSGVIEDLADQLKRMRGRIQGLEAELREVDRLRTENRELHAEVERLTRRDDRSHKRIEALEREVEKLKNGNTK
jgi:predicted RNase H-like nuclease (RuvC/YqgF family)